MKNNNEIKKLDERTRNWLQDRLAAHDGNVEAVARFLAYTCRVGSIKVCREMVNLVRFFPN